MNPIPPSPSLVWHYTGAHHLDGILEEQAIRPSKSHHQGMRRIVWFSAHEEWEPTALAAKLMDVRTGETYRMTVDELEATTGLVRIGATRSVARYDWTALQRKSGMSADLADMLARGGLNVGANPSDWYGCFGPVALDRCSEIQLRIDGVWRTWALRVPQGWEMSVAHEAVAS